MPSANKTPNYNLTQYSNNGSDKISALKDYNEDMSKIDVALNNNANNIITKADKATTYTKPEVDGKLDTKADKATTYTKPEVDGKLDTKADKADVYSKAEQDVINISQNDKINNINKSVVENKITTSIKDYGAVGDGIADDSDAIQNCINESGSHIVYIPAGTYKITRTIIIPDDTYILGESCINSKILVTDGIIGMQQKEKVATGIRIDSVFLQNSKDNRFVDNPKSIGINLCAQTFIICHCVSQYFSIGYRLNGDGFGEDYQNWVNTGEGKYFYKNDAAFCYTGIMSFNPDVIMSDCVSGPCTDGIQCGSCQISGLHVWGFSRNGISVAGNVQISNLEIESEVKTSNQIFYVYSSGSNVLSNVHIWNIHSPSGVQLTYNVGKYLIMDSVLIDGPSSDNLNKELCKLTGTYEETSLTVIRGVVSNEYTTASNIDTPQNVVLDLTTDEKSTLSCNWIKKIDSVVSPQYTKLV